MQLQNTPTRIRRRTLGALVAVGALVALSACGDDEKSETTSAATTPEVTTPAGEIAFSGQWARTSPSMATMGAVYVTITSPADDKLVGGSVDAAVAGELQIHETYMMGSDDTMAMGSETTMMGSDGTMMGSDTTMDMGGGEMGMRPVEFIALPAGTAVELKPGGYHIMLVGLVAPLEVGTTIKVTLTFENAGDITIDVPVLDEAP
ncbi:MAG: copper chaperone PCu(A)C [Ilumatobacteraceae bacterium]